MTVPLRKSGLTRRALLSRAAASVATADGGRELHLRGATRPGRSR